MIWARYPARHLPANTRRASASAGAAAPATGAFHAWGEQAAGGATGRTGSCGIWAAEGAAGRGDSSGRERKRRWRAAIAYHAGRGGASCASLRRLRSPCGAQLWPSEHSAGHLVARSGLKVLMVAAMRMPLLRSCDAPRAATASERPRVGVCVFFLPFPPLGSSLCPSGPWLVALPCRLLVAHPSPPFPAVLVVRGARRVLSSRRSRICTPYVFTVSGRILRARA